MPTAGYISLISISGTTATAVVLLALVATTPLAIGPIGVTVWFILLLFALTCWLALAFYNIAGRLQPNVSGTKRLPVAWRRGFLLAGWVVIMLGLSSLHQLSLRDVGLTALLVVIIEFYFRAKK